MHPSAKIIAEGGPIVIGEGNLIQEKAVIINRLVFYGYRDIFLEHDVWKYECVKFSPYS